MQSSTLLAIETSGRFGSVALARLRIEAGEASQTLGVEARDLPRDRRSAQTLAPAIDALLRECGLGAGELGGVAVAVGPGSFTGLRVGVTTAKTLAYATGARLVAVGTLDALTEPHLRQGTRVWGVLDAQRGELFAASYDSDSAGGVSRVRRADFLRLLAPGDQVVGPVAGALAEGCDVDVVATAEEPTAAAVARLGAARLAAGETVDPFQLVPEYHRVSAAEEKASEA